MSIENQPDAEHIKSSPYWNCPYGWRSGVPYAEAGANAADVILYEQEELGNDLDVPDFLLEELRQKHVKASDVVWVCRTKRHARRYSREGEEPYQEHFGPDALVLATDNEPETGYLVLSNARLLSPSIIQRFASYRQEQQLRRKMQLSQERM